MAQTGNVSGGVHFHEHGGRQGGHDSRTPRQLPADVRGFVNRTDELQRLNAILPGDHGDPLIVSVCVIAGTAGSGKTSLALRWAHQVQDRFPDGQLHVNLRGYDPQEPITAHEVLHRFLTALGVPARAIPADTEAAAALYRSELAERRMLIVLDNAAAVSQVRPLLPGNARSLAVVTSRSRLSGLAIRDGAHRLTLGMLEEPEAVALLRAVTAGYRPEDDAGKLVELARLCAQLPLALRIAAERAATHPHMRLDDLIADLRDESALWDALSSGDEEDADAVRSVFAWSYRALSADAARLFRLLGLQPGPAFSGHAVVALAAVSKRRARQLLDVLVGAHLLEQTAPDRYEFHDLLRAYATDQAHHEETPEARAAALRRLLDWYLHTADAAQRWIEPTRDRVPSGPPEEGVSPLSFPDYDTAVDWAEQEHGNFLPAVRAAEKAGLDQHAWQLAAVLWNAQAPSAPATEWLPLGQTGVRAAHRVGDRAAQARLLEFLGHAHTRLSRLPESLEYHGRALALRQETGDRRGEAASMNALALVHLRRRELAAAEERFEGAAAAFRELGEDHWEAVSRANLASARHQAGRSAEALDDVRGVLERHRERGNQRSVGNALRLLSALHLELGEPHGALHAAQEAVEIALDLRDHVLEGYWLLTLGNAYQELGKLTDALTSYQRAASLHRRLGDRGREGLAWHGTGGAYHRIGREDEAAAFHRRAAETFRELGDAWHEAAALDGLAVAERAARRPEKAREHWAEALRLTAGYDDDRAVRMRERIGRMLAETG